MNKIPVFYPYKMKSNSAKVIAKSFGVKCVTPNGKFMNNYCRPIINWGNSIVPTWMMKWKDQIILNPPKAVAIAVNKLETFKKFKEMGIKHPEWTSNSEEALKWWMEGFITLARWKLSAKGGEGIEIFSLNKVFKSGAPLYTKYFKKKEEYRVHVVDGKVIDFVIKKNRKGAQPNYQIRNTSNGWIFCRKGVILPKYVAEEAIKAVKALGLDFGAVDVGYNVSKNEPCVFEVNCAPGIEGQTIESYTKAFKELLK